RGVGGGGRHVPEKAHPKATTDRERYRHPKVLHPVAASKKPTWGAGPGDNRRATPPMPPSTRPFSGRVRAGQATWRLEPDSNRPENTAPPERPRDQCPDRPT